MQIFRSTESQFRLVDTTSFVGPARTKLAASSDEGVPVHVYLVEFESGGRTNWHTHSGAQWLFIVEGRVRAQKWDGPLHDLEQGDAVVFGPGEKHWHGAVPGSRGRHIAVNINLQTEWLEPVTDEQYGGGR